MQLAIGRAHHLSAERAVGRPEPIITVADATARTSEVVGLLAWEVSSRENEGQRIECTALTENTSPLLDRLP